MTDDQRIRRLEQICRSQQAQLDFQLQRLNQITQVLKKHGVDDPGMTAMLSGSDAMAMDVARRI